MLDCSVIGDQLVDGERLRCEQAQSLVAQMARARAFVATPSIARVVPHQNPEQLDRVVVRFDQLPGPGQQEERMERVPNAVERVLLLQPFSSRQPIEPPPSLRDSRPAATSAPAIRSLAPSI